ncbi:hypothetical protein [Paeniglutamicibacter antarcticus]|uniref:hypothetical protein n=1 Tax=Paeniglutamicibacter antarcticus TaxID=494023 RepID=UPI001AE698DD
MPALRATRTSQEAPASGQRRREAAAWLQVISPGEQESADRAALHTGLPTAVSVAEPTVPAPALGASGGKFRAGEPLGMPGPARSAGNAATGRPAELAGAIVFSRDVELSQVLASVAVGAGIALAPCRNADQAAEHLQEVILVGSDCVAEIDARFAGSTLVLTGQEEHQDVLWRAAASCPGARVAVLPQAGAWLGEYLGELGLHCGKAHTTIVAGAGGGAGTSTFAALLAATATLDGYRTLLLDADPHSPGLWPMLRAREPDGLGWEDLENSRGQLSPSQLAEILPLSQGTAVLSWVRSPGCFVPSEALLTEVLAASRRIYERIIIDAGHLIGVPASVVALANTRLLMLSARPGAAREGTGQRPGVHAAAWRLVLSGKLAPGTDTRVLAQRAGIELGGYFPPKRRIERATAEGSLMTVLVSRSIRRTVTRLGTFDRYESESAA